MKAFSSPVHKANCNLTWNKKYSKEAINVNLCLIVAHRIDIMFFFLSVCLVEAFFWLGYCNVCISVVMESANRNTGMNRHKSSIKDSFIHWIKCKSLCDCCVLFSIGNCCLVTLNTFSLKWFDYDRWNAIHVLTCKRVHI